MSRSSEGKRRVYARNDDTFRCTLTGCCLAFVGLLAVTGVILGAISTAHVDNHPGEDVSTFCVDVQHDTGIDTDSRVLGRISFSTHSKRVCVDMFYVLAAGCTLDGLSIKGPVNAADGLDSSNTLTTIVAADTTYENGTIGPEMGNSACAFLSPEDIRAVLRNPVLYYVEASGTGPCAARVYRDQIKSLCHNPEYDSGDVDDDDDQSDHDSYGDEGASSEPSDLHSATNANSKLSKAQTARIEAELKAHRKKQ